jgi:hypothetical protein
MGYRKMLVYFGVFALTLTVTGVLQAGEKEDMAEMQKKLNQNVMERPFNPGDKVAIDAYLAEAIKNATPPPQQQPPQNWQPGWTCNNLMGSYYQYRNCLHYYRYYGHYYGY